MRFEYTTEGSCSKAIRFDFEDGRVRNIEFESGCPGNLKAIATLVDGWSAEDIAEKLQGNQCSRSPIGSSCADQLARAVRQAKAQAQPCPQTQAQPDAHAIVTG